MYGAERRRIGDMLVEQGLISEEQLHELLAMQAEMEETKLGELAIAKGLLDEDQLLHVISEQLGIPIVDLSDLIIEPEVPGILTPRIAIRHQILPIEERADGVTIAMSDPTNVQGIDDASLIINKPIDIVLARRDDLIAHLEQFYGGADGMSSVLDDITEDDLELIKDEADLSAKKEDVEDNKIVKYVNLIILEAIKNRASDIHMEPFENEFVIRQRIDGVLQKMPAPPRQVQSAVTSRIKVMADLNIAEARLPQDGRIRLRLAGKEIDMRVSTLPTIFGESVVLRLLDRSAKIMTLEELGMVEKVRKKTEGVIDNPNGIVVVTGPTGSGKTSTLYAFVDKIFNPEDKMITVEDPVEYEVDGLTQVQVREKVGMTFAAALRSILRQDPDTVLIGEIRDVETAEISIQASLTGHLVLSTLHTNEAAGAITRLIDMGMEPFLLTSTILGICGQRLVRNICPVCKEIADVDPEKIASIAPAGFDPKSMTFYRGKGCEECSGTGYKGRTGLFELLVMSEEMQDLVLQKAPANILHNRARELGMQTMMEDGFQKILQGITTVDEVIRVAPIDPPLKKTPPPKPEPEPEAVSS